MPISLASSSSVSQPWGKLLYGKPISVITIAGNDASSNTKEKKVDINMKENVAYEIPPSQIKMTENEAYGTLPKRT